MENQILLSKYQHNILIYNVFGILFDKSNNSSDKVFGL